MDILETLLARYGCGGVLVQLTKVLSKLALLLDAKVLLVAEEDNTSCRNQSCKIVLLEVGEVGKVYSVNLGADLGVVVKDLCSVGEEVLKVDITKAALVGICVLFKCRPCDRREAWSQVLELICVVMLCYCCASWNVVVRVGLLDSLLGYDGCRVVRLEGWLYKSWCHLDSSGDVKGEITCIDPLCKVPGGNGGVEVVNSGTYRFDGKTQRLRVSRSSSKK